MNCGLTNILYAQYLGFFFRLLFASSRLRKQLKNLVFHAYVKTCVRFLFFVIYIKYLSKFKLVDLLD